MTEKRFYYAHGVVWDTKKLNGLNGISINDLDKGLRVAIWLNELNDENKQLKEALIELKEIGDYQYTRIKELSDENEQLEQTNQRLTIALKEIKEKTNIYLEMTKKGEDQP